MSTITSVTDTSSLQQSSSSDTTLGKEDFLTLLVAQLQNQDPLNPTDPTEFTSQLAEYSSLEQLIDINSNLEGMVTGGGTDLLSGVGMLGKDVVAEQDEVEYSGSSLTLGYRLDSDADAVTVTIRDGDGNVVRTLDGSDLEEGTHFLTWDGMADDGTGVSQGSYSIHVEESRGEQSQVGTSLVRATVTALEVGGTGTALITDAGTIAFGSIISIREQGDS